MAQNNDQISILLQDFDTKHMKNYARRVSVIKEVYKKLCEEAAAAGKASGFNDKDAEFYFDDYPKTKAAIDKMIADFAGQMESIIVEGNKEEWLLSAEKNARMVTRIFKGTGISKEQIEEWTRPHLDALDVFQKRKEKGMGLSERVWNLSQQTKSELELALDIGLGEGKSAADLSRDVRQYLNEPNKLFRRVRDKHGNLRLSKAAAAYHPGQGVYRSSYKNALRMTATENNMAYRTSDHEQWGKLDFVIGLHIQLSNNHTIKDSKGDLVPLHDVCDNMVGDYPKAFKYVGWHPHCRCIVTPILADWEEQLKVMKMRKDGEDVSNYHFKGEITDMPPGFTNWIENNRDRILRAKSMPYFIKDNYVGGSIDNKLRWQVPPKQQAKGRTREEIKAAADARHAARTPQQIQDIQDRAALRQDEMQYSPEMRAMFREIEKKLGIKRGFSMPYLRADRQNANPNYSKGQEYQINCQTCSAAYMLRRWGFDVTAKPNTPGSLNRQLSSKSQRKEAWRDKSGTHSKDYITFDKWMQKKGYRQMTDKRYAEYFSDVCKDDGIYELGLSWKGGGGHRTIIQKVNGKISYVEPQIDNNPQGNRYWDNLKKLCGQMTTKPSSYDGAMRVDDALFNVEKYIGIFATNKAVSLHTQRVLNEAAERQAKRTKDDVKRIKAAWQQRKKDKQIFFDIKKVTTAEQLKALRSQYTGNDENVRKAFIAKAAEIRHANRDDAAVLATFKKRQADVALVFKQADNIAKVANKTPWIDAMDVAELTNPNYYKHHVDELKAKTAAMVKRIQDTNKAIKEIEEYIPNVKAWAKTYTAEQLKGVRDNVIKNLNKWNDAWNTDPWIPKKYASKEDYFKHKITTEITYVVTTGKTKYVTWDVAEYAYTKQLEIVNNKIWIKTADAKIIEMEAFAASHSKSPIFAASLVKLKDAYKYASTGDKTDWNVALAEIEAKKHNLELRDAQRAKKKLHGSGNPNERIDLRKSVANDEQLFKAASKIYNDKQGTHPDIAAELEDAIKNKQRNRVLQLTKQLGEDLNNPYNKYRKDAAQWFKNSRDAHDHFFDQCVKAWGNGTDEERYAGYNYTEGSQYLTNSLRGNDGWCYDLGLARKPLDVIKRDANALTSWLAKNKFDEDIWLKRDEVSSITNDIFGINLNDHKSDYIKINDLNHKIEALEKVKKIADETNKKKIQKSIDKMQNEITKLQSLEGKVGIDESFASTGNNKDTWFGRKDVCLNIYCPNGTNGIYASPFSHYEGNGGYHFDGKSKFIYYSENEIILQRGNNLRITKVEWNENDQRWYIDVEILEQNPREIIDWQTDALSTEGRHQGCRAIFKK